MGPYKMNDVEKRFAQLSMDEDIDINSRIAIDKETVSRPINLDAEEAKWFTTTQQKIDAQLGSFDALDNAKLDAFEMTVLDVCKDPLSLSKPAFKTPFVRTKREKKRKNKVLENATTKEQSVNVNVGISTIYTADPVLEGLKFTDDVFYATKDKEWLELAKKHFVEFSKLTTERRRRMISSDSFYHPSRANENPSFWHVLGKKGTSFD